LGTDNQDGRRDGKWLPWPFETILLSICLEHGKMIEEILGLRKEKS
jgi:hypothetical protein